MNHKSWLVALVASLGLVACGGPLRFAAPEPRPNFVSAGALPGAIKVDVSGVPDPEICSDVENNKDLCVTGFRAALGSGLERLIGAYKQGDAPMVAKFELVEFSHAPSVINSQQMTLAMSLTMRWKLTISDASGNQVFALAETTQGSRPILDYDQTAASLKTLEDEVLERVAEGLNQLAGAGPGADGPEPTVGEPAAGS